MDGRGGGDLPNEASGRVLLVREVASEDEVTDRAPLRWPVRLCRSALGELFCASRRIILRTSANCCVHLGDLLIPGARYLYLLRPGVAAYTDLGTRTTAYLRSRAPPVGAEPRAAAEVAGHSASSAISAGNSRASSPASRRRCV